MRAVALATRPPPSDDIAEFEQPVPMRDGFENIARIRRSKTPSTRGSPLIVLIFGGGFIAGDNGQMTAEACALVRLFNAMVVNISYRLAPERKFPAAQHDTLDNLKWLSQHAAELGADPRQGFIVGGTSAGAKLAAVCAMHAQVEPLAFPLTGQWLNVPWLIDKHQVPERWTSLFTAREQNEDAPILATADLLKVLEYTGADETSAWWTPLNVTRSLAGLPKTYIQVDGMDPLRDDGLLYDEMLKEAGVESRCDLYPGVPHAHAAFMADTQVAEKSVVDLLLAVGWMLDRTVTRAQAIAVLAHKSRGANAYTWYLQ